MSKKRVVSGMRPTGALHIGHYFGALKNWVKMQEEFDCFFFIADWHALTTNYENPEDIRSNSRAMLLDWLSVGLDINKSTIYTQSHNPYIAELFLLLGMLTPTSWLERCPTYKEQLAQLTEKSINNFGFLGYPVLMTADIIIYNADYVPVGIDQIPHLEIAREIVRRFHFLYNSNIFKEPEAMLTDTPKLLGLDGRKMSKSYGNSIMLSEEMSVVEKKVRAMVTDSNRVKKTDTGNPDICPVFDYHKIFSTDEERAYIVDGCRGAKIGCIECKMILFKHLKEFLEPIQERRNELDGKIKDTDEYLYISEKKAIDEAKLTVEKMRQVLKI